MPPIRTFNSAPINQNIPPTAAKQENNATPPLPDEQQQHSIPLAAPATTTSAASTRSGINSSTNQSVARPGASAVPGPTAAPVSARPPPTKTYPLFDDTNTDTNNKTPAAPQPGARPVPPPGVAAATPTSNKSSYTVPPPPKTGEPVQPAEYYAPKTTQQQPTTPAGGLVGSFAQEKEGMITTNVPNSTSTPYLSTYQPPSAQPLPSPSSRFTTGIGNMNTNNSSNAAGPLYAGDEDSILGESGQKVFDTAKSWMQTAGNKLAEAEAEVWKMVNSK